MLVRYVHKFLYIFKKPILVGHVHVFKTITLVRSVHEFGNDANTSITEYVLLANDTNTSITEWVLATVGKLIRQFGCLS